MQLPWDLQLASFVQAKSGTRGERSYVFRSIPNASTITKRLGERGTLNNPSYLTTNLKMSRAFPMGKGSRLHVTFDAFNIFNAATATAYQGLGADLRLHHRYLGAEDRPGRCEVHVLFVNFNVLGVTRRTRTRQS